MEFSVVFQVEFPGETVLTGRDLNQVRNGCHSFEVRAHGSICLDRLILVTTPGSVRSRCNVSTVCTMHPMAHARHFNHKHHHHYIFHSFQSGSTIKPPMAILTNALLPRYVFTECGFHVCDTVLRV